MDEPNESPLFTNMNLEQYMQLAYEAFKERVSKPRVFHPHVQYTVVESATHCRACGKAIEPDEVHLVGITCLKIVGLAE